MRRTRGRAKLSDNLRSAQQAIGASASATADVGRQRHMGDELREGKGNAHGPQMRGKVGRTCEPAADEAVIRPGTERIIVDVDRPVKIPIYLRRWGCVFSSKLRLTITRRRRITIS